MKKTFIFCSFFIAMIQTVSAQANKTNLSLQVSAAAAANRETTRQVMYGDERSGV